MRALVVDDELATRALLSGLLRAAGLEVTVASDGDEAWQLHEAKPFPLVVTDWMMPKMTGIELVERIRGSQLPETYTYILVVSTLSASELTLRAFQAGADDMLSKPVDAPQIGARLAVAQRFLGAHARSQEAAFSASLVAMQSELGHEHVALTTNLSALAQLYRGRGALARARAFIRREIEVRIHAHGPDDPRVAELRAELASLQDPPA